MQEETDRPLIQKNIYEVPFLSNQHGEFVLWYFTGSKCNLSCTHCYVESSPTANQHPFLTYNTFKEKLQETLDIGYKKLEIYFTGGEPFLNPDMLKMLETSLIHADTTVLTNATRISKKIAMEIKNYENKGGHSMKFRVSLDGPDAASHNKIRGNRAFELTNEGIDNLISAEFTPIITAMRSWDLLDHGDVEDEFIELLIDHGIPREDQLLKILPPIRSGREVQRNRGYSESELFTEECFPPDYDYNLLQCSKCRMVSERGVWVCPILINDDSAKMGDTIKETTSSYKMRQLECWTCRMEGMSCEN